MMLKVDDYWERRRVHNQSEASVCPPFLSLLVPCDAHSMPLTSSYYSPTATFAQLSTLCPKADIHHRGVHTQGARRLILWRW
jgi:hypothetical protein